MIKIHKPTPSNFEPMLTNRFEVIFPKEMEIESWLFQSITKPKFRIDKWDNIYVEILDIVGPSTSKIIFDFLEKNNYKNEFEFSVFDLDPTGVRINEYKINVEEILLIDFGKFKHTKNEHQIITMILKPKNCTCLTPSTI